MLREIDHLAMNAKTDRNILEDLVRQNEFLIIKIASKVTCRYITKSDDEYSIALIAFTEAIQSYDLEKGSFLSFAELIIRRRLIDYIRSQGKYESEVSVDPVLFDTEPEDEDDNVSIRIAVADQVSKQENSDLKFEIQAMSKVFSDYGFTFFDLSSCSPRAKKTKASCAAAVNYILDNPMLINEIKGTKQLPLKIIEKNTKVPRKILERHRKYIIAAIEILSGGYPNLAEYLRFIRKEGGK